MLGIVKGLQEKVNPECFLRQTDLTLPCRSVKIRTDKLSILYVIIIFIIDNY